jgi:hypothetical protein
MSNKKSEVVSASRNINISSFTNPAVFNVVDDGIIERQEVAKLELCLSKEFFQNEGEYTPSGYEVSRIFIVLH